MDSSQPAESFRNQLLRHRGRTRLTQRELAQRLGVHPRSVQDWETGVNHPSAERLKGLIAALLETGGLSAGHEADEAEELWIAVERESARMRTAFDRAWLAGLLAERTAAAGTRRGAGGGIPAGCMGSAAEAGAAERRQDWGQAPDMFGFVGRPAELAVLRRWVLDERSRLVAVLGMGGIGKTSLAARLAQEVAPSFARVYWRSLRDAPPPGEWLAGAIGFLSDQQLMAPPAESERIAALLQLLRERRCLLVLDNVDTLFEPGQGGGRYREGMAGYSGLLQAMGEASHQSCLVLTSRETPPELAVLGGGAVRTLELGGLGVDEAQVLLAPKQLEGTTQQWAELNARLGGNGLALKGVGQSIRELFAGDVGVFLEETGGSSVFGGIRRLLAEQIERSSALEQQVLRVLAVEREPVRVADLVAALGSRIGRAAVLEAVEALRRRSLVERAEVAGPAAFTLQSLVLEYVTDRLVEAVADEIARGQPVLLVEQPLIKALAQDYVRQTQEQLIGEPVIERLQAECGPDGAERLLLALLEGWRNRPAEEVGYGLRNVINLMRLLRGELRGLDLSRLSIRQAPMQGVDVQDASLANAQVSASMFGEAFGAVSSIAVAGLGDVHWGRVAVAGGAPHATLGGAWLAPAASGA